MIRIAGFIPINIYPIFWILALAIGWLNSGSIPMTLVFAVIVFVSVLIHEFGHALTGKAFGQRVQIDLMGLGGLTQRRGPKITLFQEFLIVLNGPLAGVLLIGLFVWMRSYVLDKMTEPNIYVVQTLSWAIQINIFWTIVNLLPIQPLDGGHLLRIVMEGIFGLKGVKAALLISTIFGALATLFFFINQNLLGGAILFMLTYESYKSWRASLPLSENDQNAALQHLLKEGEKELRRGHLDEALEKFEALRRMTKSGAIYQTATFYTADLLSEKGDYKAALELLSPLEKSLPAEGIRLLHQLVYREAIQTKDYSKAIAIGNKAYRLTPSSDTALLNAFSHAAQKEVEQTIGWLQCAAREGMPNLFQILSQGEFDGVRESPLFQKLSFQVKKGD